MRLVRFLSHLTPLVLLVPMCVGAQVQTVSQIAGIFNVFVGLVLTVALLTYGVGVIVWVVRLGTWPSYRTTAIRVLEWAVAVLFVLVVLLMIVQFFQKHTQAAAYTISVIIILAIIWIVVYLAAHSKAEKEEKH